MNLPFGRQAITVILLALLPAICLSQATDTICPNKFDLSLNGNTYSIPLCRSLELDTTHPQINHAVIVVHGASRTAVDQFGWAVEGAQLTNTDDSTIVVSPQFLILPDMIAHQKTASDLHWEDGGDGWKYGYDSDSTAAYPRDERISSFAVIDTIVKRIIDICPNLERIVFYGHSGGGQFVGRYAAGNRIEDTYNSSIAFRYVIANPSTYLYFDMERVVDGTTNQFALPDSSDVANCPNYDRYKYGLSDLDSCWYMITTTPDSIIAQFERREYALLLGLLDNDPNDTTMDNSCKAAFLGKHRLERGQIYYNYLKHYYGSAIQDNHYLELVAGVDHSAHQMLKSNAGLNYVYKNYVPTVDRVEERKLAGMEIYRDQSRESLRVKIQQRVGGSLRMVDVSGRLVQQASMKNGEALVSLQGLATGIYVLKLETASGWYSSKIAVN